MIVQKGNRIYDFMSIEVEPEIDMNEHTGCFDLIGRMYVNNNYYPEGMPVVLKTYDTEEEANKALLELSISFNVACFNK